MKKTVVGLFVGMILGSIVTGVMVRYYYHNYYGLMLFRCVANMDNATFSVYRVGEITAQKQALEDLIDTLDDLQQSRELAEDWLKTVSADRGLAHARLGKVYGMMGDQAKSAHQYALALPLLQKAFPNEAINSDSDILRIVQKADGYNR